MYKLNIILDNELVNSYKSPVIPKYQELIYFLDRTFIVKRLGHIVYSRENQNVLAELDLTVEEISTKLNQNKINNLSFFNSENSTFKKPYIFNKKIRNFFSCSAYYLL